VLLVSQSANRCYNETNKHYNSDTNKDESQHVQAEYCCFLLLRLDFIKTSGFLWNNYWVSVSWLHYWLICWFHWVYWFNYFVRCELAGGVEGNKAELGDARLILSSIEADERVLIVEGPLHFIVIDQVSVLLKARIFA